MIIQKISTILFVLIIFSNLSAIDSFSTYESAEFYHDHSSQQWNVAYEALKNYPFSGQESVLEVGCRSGKISANLAGRLFQGEVTAIEMRGSGAIEFAQQNYAQNLYPNLSFVEQDFLESNYIEQFDLVVSFSSLHWYSDQKPILQKVYQALKNRGHILFTIPGKPEPEVTALLAELMGNSKWRSYFVNYSHPRRKFNADEYDALLNETGFLPVDISLQRFEYFFENKRALINWFKAFSPILDLVPEEQKEEFLVDLANSYVQSYPAQTDGRILFIQNELFIRASKP